MPVIPNTPKPGIAIASTNNNTRPNKTTKISVDEAN